MSSNICNVPFCQNLKKKNSGLCSSHNYENSKFNQKMFKDLLPIWAVRRCKKHGLLRLSDTNSNKNNKFVCKYCTKEINNKNYNKEYQRIYMNKRYEHNKFLRLKKIYGISKTQYYEKLENQNYICAICKKIRLNKPLALDHCHKSGKVRDFLCGACNRGLGFFDDNYEYLISAAEYIRHHKGGG